MKKEERKIENELPPHLNNTSILLSQIADLQVSKSDSHFVVGTFPAFRENKLLRYHRPDDNIFSTASTIFILNEIKDYLSAKEQSIVEKLTLNAQSAYPLYQNKDGLSTYNFWKTKPSRHFPHGYLLHKLRHFKLPDDIDDTALIYLTNPQSEEENRWLKDKLMQHSQKKNASKRYVYSTWFGENMPIEQDVCALCNLMYWVFESELPLNEYDTGTLRFLKKKILSGDFRKQPFQTARHYASVPLILYHYARLMYKFNVQQLADCESVIVNQVISLINTKCSPMNEILLSTVLLKLAPKSEILKRFKWRNTPVSDEKFYSFIGAFLAPYTEENNSFIAEVAAFPLMRFNWKCQAHEFALQLENLVLLKSLG